MHIHVHGQSLSVTIILACCPVHSRHLSMLGQTHPSQETTRVLLPWLGQEKQKTEASPSMFILQPEPDNLQSPYEVDLPPILTYNEKTEVRRVEFSCLVSPNC